MWLFSALILGASTFTYSILYNLYLHPLRSVPGPKLYAISRIPWIRDWLSGSLHISVQRLHERYGPAVRVAPDEVSFINSSAWNDIYGSKGVRSVERDRKWYANLTEGQDDIIVANEADHMRFRKIFAPAFSDRALRENEGVVVRNIDLLILKLRGHLAENDGTADMTQWYNWATFDIIGNLVYGESFGCLEKMEYHPWLKVVLQNIRLSSYAALLERYPIFKRLLTVLLPHSMLEMRNMHLAVIKAKLARHATGHTSQKDVVSLVAAGDVHITDRELEANLGLITMAGSETSATTLTAASFYLAQNQDAARKVRRELDAVVRREEDISHDKVKNLPYLNAVIKETLRLYPPTPVGLPRRVISNDGLFVGDIFVPKDMAVYVTQYSAYRSALNFHQPSSFHPERWLGDPRFAADDAAVVQPFLTGPYSCIGKSLAYMEVSLILARMVWNFDWELQMEMPGENGFEREKVFALWQKSEMRLRLVERRRD